jgi:hypothetical protein
MDWDGSDCDAVLFPRILGGQIALIGLIDSARSASI